MGISTMPRTALVRARRRCGSALMVIGISGFIEQANADGVDRTLPRHPLPDAAAGHPRLRRQLGSDELAARRSRASWRRCMAATAPSCRPHRSVFRDQFHRYRLRYAKGHTIVCGLGDTGARIAASFAAAGERVVAIEPDRRWPPQSGVVEHARRTCSPGAPPTLHSLRLSRVLERAARIVVVACGTDATNVQVTVRRGRLRCRTARARRCAARCSSTTPTSPSLLRAADLESHGGARISYFNLHERAARALLAEHGPTVRPG